MAFRIYGIKRLKVFVQEKAQKLEETQQFIKGEYLEQSMEKYKLINARLEEMRLEIEDIDDLMKKVEGIFD